MGRIFITPLAKKLASLNSLNIKDVTGTGPRGRITKIDIEKHLKLSASTTDNEQKSNPKLKANLLNSVSKDAQGMYDILQRLDEATTKVAEEAATHLYEYGE